MAIDSLALGQGRYTVWVSSAGFSSATIIKQIFNTLINVSVVSTSYHFLISFAKTTLFIFLRHPLLCIAGFGQRRQSERQKDRRSTADRSAEGAAANRGAHAPL